MFFLEKFQLEDLAWDLLVLWGCDWDFRRRLLVLRSHQFGVPKNFYTLPLELLFVCRWCYLVRVWPQQGEDDNILPSLGK